jgi:hypothetical protein
VGAVSTGRSLKRAQDTHTGSIKLIPTSLNSHHIRTPRDFIMTVLSLATILYTNLIGYHGPFVEEDFIVTPLAFLGHAAFAPWGMCQLPGAAVPNSLFASCHWEREKGTGVNVVSERPTHVSLLGGEDLSQQRRRKEVTDFLTPNHKVLD